MRRNFADTHEALVDAFDDFLKLAWPVQAMVTADAIDDVDQFIRYLGTADGIIVRYAETLIAGFDAHGVLEPTSNYRKEKP